MHQPASPFYFVQSGDNLSSIARRLFDLHSPGAIARQVSQLYRSNPHLASPDKIYPGQVLYVGHGMDFNDRVFASDMLAMEALFRTLSPQQGMFLRQNIDTIQVLGAEGGAALASALTRDPSWRTAIPGVISVAQPTKEGLSFAKKIMDTGIRASEGQFGKLLKVSPHTWDVVHGDLVRGVERQVRYVRSQNLLRLVPAGMRALQQEGKVVLIQSSGSGLRAFSDQVQKMRKVGESLSTAKKFTGYLGTGLTLAISGAHVAQAWGSPSQNRTVVKESTKVASGLLLAEGAAATATGVCLLLDFTTGIGGVACHLGVVVIYGVAASRASDMVGEKAARVYESHAGKRLP